MLHRLTFVAMIAALVGLTHSASAAIVTWDGGGADANWMTPANWVGDVAPVAGDSLVFDGGVQTTNTNNFPVGTNFAGISIPATAGPFILNTTTATINLSGDVINSRPSGTTTINPPLALQNNVNYEVTAANKLHVQVGAISGGFKLTKTGAGILSTTGSNTFTGGFDITGGIVRGSVSGNTTASLGTGAISISNGSALELRSTTATNFNNALVLGTGGGKIDARSNHSFNPASISGSGELTLRPTGADNLVFTTTDMKAGPSQWSGQVVIDRNGRNSFGLRLGNSFVSNSLLNAAITLNDNTFISRQNGTNQPGTNIVDIGTLSSSFANTSLGNSTAGTGYFVYSIGARNENSSFAGNIINGSTASALRKVGTGTLTLAGTANTFSGPSEINAGRLNVNGALTNATLALTVNTGGTLGGTGPIAGSTTVSGGTIAPGTSIGTLNTASVVIGPSGTFEVEYNVSASQPIDLLNVVGNLTLDATSVVTFVNLNSGAAPLTDARYVFAKYTGSLTGTAFGTVNSLPIGYMLDFSVPNEIALITAIPEVSSFVAVGAALGGLALVARRRHEGVCGSSHGAQVR